MAVASFVFSAVALALSGAAFGWQILSWFMSGGRVRAQLRIGCANSAGIVSTPADLLKNGWFERLARQGYVQPIAAVRVHNRGRLPVYINRWGVEVASASFNPVAGSIGPDLPFKLEPGQDETWALPLEAVLMPMNSSREVFGGSDKLNGFVVLGTGKEIKTSETVSERQLKSGLP
jgi:hypothetical protein